MTLSRDEAILLLPFLANGTLEGNELRQVEQAIEADPTLQAELAALQNIRATLRAEQIDFSPGEMGLARLMRDVEAERKAAPAAGAMLWKIAAALLFVIAIGQTVLLTTDGAPEAGYTLAGGAKADFSITVQPDATEAELRELLLDAGVEIVSGPSALGIYELALTQTASRDSTAEKLRAASDIIESLEMAD
jgi:anti-sigma factor RsiW